MVVLFMPMPRPSCVADTYYAVDDGYGSRSECSAMDFGYDRQQLVDDPNVAHSSVRANGASLVHGYSCETPTPLPPSRVSRSDQQWGFWIINSRGLPVRLPAGERA